jgi:hypothetical protein
MKKSILYRLFGLGAFPKGVLPGLEQEELVVMDEGIGGWFVTQHVKGPGKRYRHRSEGFVGSLAVTRERVICYTFRKPQINIAVKDPKVSKLYVDAASENKLCVSFDSAHFREGWEGVIEFRFNTDKAFRFRDALIAIGAQHGTAAEADKPFN